MSIILQSSGGGSVTIAEPATASNFTQTLPAATGTVMVSGNMPAFSAYASSDQTVTNSVITKINLGTEQFDTNNNFASSRFTPTVAGYYQINGAVQAVGSAQPAIFIFKNGSSYTVNSIGISTTNGSLQISSLIYFNGSTDYVELYAVTYGGTQFYGGLASTYMDGCLVRVA
jgi:hypothetical protein